MLNVVGKQIMKIITHTHCTKYCFKAKIEYMARNRNFGFVSNKFEVMDTEAGVINT